MVQIKATERTENKLEKEFKKGDEIKLEKKKIVYLKFMERLISKDNFKSFNRKTGLPFLSDEYKSFERKISWEAKSDYQGKILTGDLQVLIVAYYKNKVHPDLFNLPKSCMDALNKIIWRDDRQIKKGMVEVIENSDKEYFEIYIKEI